MRRPIPTNAPTYNGLTKGDLLQLSKGDIVYYCGSYDFHPTKLPTKIEVHAVANVDRVYPDTNNPELFLLLYETKIFNGETYITHLFINDMLNTWCKGAFRTEKEALRWIEKCLKAEFEEREEEQ